MTYGMTPKDLESNLKCPIPSHSTNAANDSSTGTGFSETNLFFVFSSKCLNVVVSHDCESRNLEMSKYTQTFFPSCKSKTLGVEGSLCRGRPSVYKVVIQLHKVEN
jgi:hypothetical protein